MITKQITCEIIQATRPYENLKRGLITIQVECPLYIWTELLTHRRFSRNASSARAMSTKRYTDMGYYLPDTWYMQGDGMKSGEPITSIETIRVADTHYIAAVVNAEKEATRLESIGIAKEQRNRLIPPIKMIRGIVTGTESAWGWFLSLRDNAAADKAMQKLAHRVVDALQNITWSYGCEHRPFYDGDIQSAVAHIARVSYNRESGKEGAALYDMLLTEKHLSPFEHIATWKPDPLMSNFTCKEDDVKLDSYEHEVQWWKNQYSGWQSYRSEHEVLTTI